MKLTAAMKKAFEALGCRPLICHACGNLIEIGSELTGVQGYFCHFECRDKPILLHIDPEIKAKLAQEVAEVGGLAAVLNGQTGDWQSQVVTDGPAFTFEEVMAAYRD